MGWLKTYLSDDSRGPRNSAEWRARHPEYKGPYRKKGTVLDPNAAGYSPGWAYFPEMYERVPKPPETPELDEDGEPVLWVDPYAR